MRNDAVGRAIVAARNGDLVWFEESFISEELQEFSFEILSFAVRYGHFEVVKFIFEETSYQISISAESNRLLCEAVSNGHLYLLEYLIRNDTQAELVTESILPAAEIAIRNGYPECFDVLFETFTDQLQTSDCLPQLLEATLQGNCKNSFFEVLKYFTDEMFHSLNLYRFFEIASESDSLELLITLFKNHSLETQFSTEEILVNFEKVLRLEHQRSAELYLLIFPDFQKFLVEKPSKLSELRLRLIDSCSFDSVDWITSRFSICPTVKDIEVAVRRHHFKLARAFLRELPTELQNSAGTSYLYYAAITNTLIAAKKFFVTGFSCSEERLREILLISTEPQLTGKHTTQYILKHLE